MADPSADGSTVVEDEVPTPSQDATEDDIERAKSNHSARVEARKHDQAANDSLDQGYTNSSGGGKEGRGGGGGGGQLVRQWTLKIGDDKASSTILADQVCMDLRAGRPQALEKMKKAMLMGKLSINDQDEHFCPLIMAAVQGGMAEATSELVFRGVDPSSQDNDKNTPLHVAYLFDHQDLVQFLISKGAKTTVRNLYNHLPSDMSMAGVRKLYFEATVVDDVVYLQTGLGKGWVTNADVAGKADMTLLMYAAESGSFKCVKLLVQKKADLDAADGNGDTPSHHAFRNNMREIGEFLVSKGASVSAANNAGVTVYEEQRLMFQRLVASGEIHAADAPSTDALLSPEVALLKKYFDEHSAGGQQGLGGGGGAGGRSATMDFREFLTALPGLELTIDKVSKSMASKVFQQVSPSETGDMGELEWLEFRHAIYVIANHLGLKEVYGVAAADLEVPKSLRKSKSKLREWDKFDLCTTSKLCLRREMGQMQRQLNAMANRAKETTSCQFAAYGHGVTTGKHKISRQTLNIYAKLHRVKTEKLVIPKFEKNREIRKKEFLAKNFFNTIDKDMSGELTSYELLSALRDYGFTKEEQEEVFDLVDGDRSGSVTLSEFIKGMNEGNIDMSGRVSKSQRVDSFLNIALNISKSVKQRTNADKVISISPGLFGQIFKMYTDHAIHNRLAYFDQRSCVYAAPTLSAEAAENVLVHKASDGINTRFAAVNPFDQRVLSALTPDSLRSPDASAGMPPMSSARPPRTSHGTSHSSPMGSPLRNSSETGSPLRPATVAGHGGTRDSLSPDRVSMSTQSGGLRSYYSQARTINPGNLQGLSPMRRQRLFKEPVLVVSPDGKLLSEHTRITLIPHRVTSTSSGQLLAGGVETHEDMRNPGTIAQQAVKKHKVTVAGVAMLNRLSFVSISLGGGHCVGATDTGLVYTWGQGRYGQLGHGDDLDNIVPRPVQGIKGEVKVASAGFYHSVAVTKQGVVFTWGDGRLGKLGHNDESTRLLPTLVNSFFDQSLVVATAQAGGQHTVALSNEGQVYTFGAGQSGRLGHGNDKNQLVPTLVAALEFEEVVSIASGYAHTVVLTGEGEIHTWGSGKMGRLGHGADSDEVLPRRVTVHSHPTIKPVAVAAGEAHTCVLRSDGSLVTMGRVTHGRSAEGVSIESVQEQLKLALSLQSHEDWAHFPA